MGLTSDPNDPRLTHGSDETPVDQAEVYLVMSDEEREKGWVRPLRKTYFHTTCGHTTTMATAIAETYAANPKYYGATYCATCRKHRPVDEFYWEGTNEPVGS